MEHGLFRNSMMRIQMEKTVGRGWDTTQLCMWSRWWQLKYFVFSSLFGKICNNTLHETNSSHLKIDGWKMRRWVSFQVSAPFQGQHGCSFQEVEIPFLRVFLQRIGAPLKWANWFMKKVQELAVNSSKNGTLYQHSTPPALKNPSGGGYFLGLWTLIWSNNSDLTLSSPQEVAFWRGYPLISRKFRLVNYHNLARLMV